MVWAIFTFLSSAYDILPHKFPLHHGQGRVFRIFKSNPGELFSVKHHDRARVELSWQYFLLYLYALKIVENYFILSKNSGYIIHTKTYIFLPRFDIKITTFSQTDSM